MNGFSAADMSTAAANGFRDGLAAQPGTAQEAVAWFTDDHLTDRSATTYDAEVAERWRAKGWPVTPLYAAPVSAAPVDGDFDGASYKRMFIDACKALAEVSRELDCDPEQGGVEPILAAIAKLKASTPAAPGIELEPLIAIRNQLHQMSAAKDLGEGWADVVIELMGDVQKVIDASPKGDEEVSVEEDVYCAIADMIEPYVQRASKPDGLLPASVHDSVQILLEHWVATKASPRGGSKSITDADRLDFIASEFLHIESVEIRASEDDADVGWVISQYHMGKGLVELIRWNDDNLRSAIDAAMQPTSHGAGVSNG